MAFDRREIVVAIIRWLTASGVEQSLGEFVAQLENDFVGEGQQMNLRQLRLLVEYTSFELTDHKIVQSNKAGVNPRKAIDPSIREIISQIILSQDWSSNPDHKNSASKMRQSLEETSEFPTRLKFFLETNELNIADLFQLSLAELEKVPNFGPDTLNFISFFMRKNGNQFSETTKIHEIVKNPYEALLSTKSKRLVDELSNDEVQQIRTLGPEGIVKLPRLSSVGKKTSREIYDYFSSTVFQKNTNSETHLEQKKPSHLLTLSELSKDELELILTPLDYLNLKPRVRSGLKNSGIIYLGQIASLDRSEFLKLPNTGKSSWNEIFAIVQKYDLLLYANIEWPGHEFVKDLITRRQLDVGKPLAIGSSAATTIEQEARDIFAQALSPIQFKILVGRVGLGDHEFGMTLQELADAKIVGEKVVTRERVRQLEAGAIRKIKKIKLSAELLQKCLEVISSHSILLKVDAVKKLHDNGLSKHSDPITLIKRLCDIGLGSFNHKDHHVPFIGETLLFDPGKIVPGDLKRFFVELKRGILGNAFASITSSTLDRHDGRTGELETALSLSRNLVCIRFNDDLYVAKRPKRLVARKNKLITSLVKIFCVSRSSSIRDLYEGVKKTRNLRDEFPFEVFHEFVSRLDFFELNETIVSCLSPPGNNPLTKGEKIIVNLANEDGDILDSETLHRTLIQHGISSPRARQVVIYTPLLFSIKKGHYRQKGLYKFVGNLDAPLVEGSQEHRISEDFLIQIKVESKTRMLGRVSITEKLPKEGDYDVYDQDENFICVLQHQGVTLSGLRPLLKDTDAQKISLRFEASSGCFIAE